MPVYEFRCDDCHQIVERYFKMDQCPDAGGCPVCTGTARKILPMSYGIKSDTPAWLNDQVRDVLQKDGEPPIETRKQHDDYLRKNGIVQRA